MEISPIERIFLDSRSSGNFAYRGPGPMAKEPIGPQSYGEIAYRGVSRETLAYKIRLLKTYPTLGI